MTLRWTEIFISAMFFFAGTLSICAAVFNWHWFFESSNAKLLTGRYSRRTARIIYLITGCLILAMDSFIVSHI